MTTLILINVAGEANALPLQAGRRRVPLTGLTAELIAVPPNMNMTLSFPDGNELAGWARWRWTTR